MGSMHRVYAIEPAFKADEEARRQAEMTDPWNLERFIDAQDERDTWEAALAEIRSGHKVSHWMWFVFPQLAALGRSSTAKFYGLSGIDEAEAYLSHPQLGPRLIECIEAVLALETKPEVVFGPIDAMKLRSCATLFSEVTPSLPAFATVIEKFFDGTPDDETLALLR